MNDNQIIIKNVVKSFNSKVVLDIPDFYFSRGDVVAFLGMNGSGKTTLMKMICGLLYQDQGEILVFGKDNHSSYTRQNTKFVFESGKGYYTYLSAYENMRYFIGLNKINFENIKESLYELIDFFEFREHLHKKVISCPKAIGKKCL